MNNELTSVSPKLLHLSVKQKLYVGVVLFTKKDSHKAGPIVSSELLQSKKTGCQKGYHYIISIIIGHSKNPDDNAH